MNFLRISQFHLSSTLCPSDINTHKNQPNTTHLTNVPPHAATEQILTCLTNVPPYAAIKQILTILTNIPPCAPIE